MTEMGPGLRREDEIFGNNGVLPRGAARMPSTAQRGGDSMGRRNRGTCPMLDAEKLGNFVDRCWGDLIVPTLVEYIKIPNKSPSFDPDWATHGYMEDAVTLFEGWARQHIAALPGASLDIIRLPGRTPLMLIEVPGEGPVTDTDPVLLYGHLDKQPEMVGWTEGYGAWIPRLEGDRLYGRGGADDGYAMFGALTALEAVGSPGTELEFAL